MTIRKYSLECIRVQTNWPSSHMPHEIMFRGSNSVVLEAPCFWAGKGMTGWCKVIPQGARGVGVGEGEGVQAAWNWFTTPSRWQIFLSGGKYFLLISTSKWLICLKKWFLCYPKRKHNIKGQYKSEFFLLAWHWHFQQGGEINLMVGGNFDHHRFTALHKIHSHCQHSTH